MNEEELNKEFRRVADAFIDLANKEAENFNPENVGMSLLYAASRYNAFVVAHHANNLEAYNADRKKAVEFFSREYERMLSENLDDYQRKFDESFKYQEFMKKD